MSGWENGPDVFRHQPRPDPRDRHRFYPAIPLRELRWIAWHVGADVQPRSTRAEVALAMRRAGLHP
jgi:hypothetical protein